MNIMEIINLISLETLRKHSYVIKVFIVVTASYFVAVVVNSEFIAPLIKTEDVRKDMVRRARTTKIKEIKQREYYDIIIDRNIFDSTDKPVPGGKTAMAQTGGEGLSADGPSVPTSLSIQLVGTMVLNNPKWSLAIITGGGQRNSNIYKINDIILSSAIIVKITRNKVVFKNNGRLEHIEIKEQELSFIPDNNAGEIGVSKLSEGKYAISRRELDAAFSDLSTILTQARVVPHFEEGKTVGFRIFAIQPNSIYQRLGLNNHDIIARVNGMMIDDPTKGLQMFNTLKKEKKVELDIIRDGAKQTITLDIN